MSRSSPSSSERVPGHAVVCSADGVAANDVLRPKQWEAVIIGQDLKGSIDDQLRAIVGAAHVLTTADVMEPFLAEPRDRWHGDARCVVRPRTRDEVSAIVALCRREDIPVVPQGGNTGLVGGQTPLAGSGAVVLSLVRMDAVREVDLQTGTMTVEAGLTLQRAQEAAERAGRLFPMWFASAGSCTIGGNLATNAGGVNVVAYGNTRDLVSGIEVVLADGRILSDLSKLKKDNTGYDLKNLFIGSEGTLGVITAAVLKLVDRPQAVETAFVGLPSPAAALDLLQRMRAKFGRGIQAFELIPRMALDFVIEAHPTCRDPLIDRHGWYVLMDVASTTGEPIHDTLLTILAEAANDLVVADAVVAASSVQARAFWSLREHVPDAQKRFGGSIKHDISVPIACVPAFLEQVETALNEAVPGCRLCAFGHLGDGNIHCNVQQPIGADKQAFLARWYEVNAIVHGIAGRFAGSISAEHGIGQLKRDLLPGVKDPVALDLMRAIKATLDPTNILNPGKVL